MLNYQRVWGVVWMQCFVFFNKFYHCSLLFRCLMTHAAVVKSFELDLIAMWLQDDQLSFGAQPTGAWTHQRSCFGMVLQTISETHHFCGPKYVMSSMSPPTIQHDFWGELFHFGKGLALLHSSMQGIARPGHLSLWTYSKRRAICGCWAKARDACGAGFCHRLKGKTTVTGGGSPETPQLDPRCCGCVKVSEHGVYLQLAICLYWKSCKILMNHSIFRHTHVWTNPEHGRTVNIWYTWSIWGWWTPYESKSIPCRIAAYTNSIRAKGIVIGAVNPFVREFPCWGGACTDWRFGKLSAATGPYITTRRWPWIDKWLSHQPAAYQSYHQLLGPQPISFTLIDVTGRFGNWPRLKEPQEDNRFCKSTAHC